MIGVAKAPPPATYALALPRSLYGDDINGNTSNMMMTQSMDPAHLAARLDNNATPSVLRSQQELHPQDIMTASLDPSLLAGYEPLQVQSKIFFNCFFFTLALDPEMFLFNSLYEVQNVPQAIFLTY